MSDLRKKLIRLAYHNPELRRDLLPLIQKSNQIGHSQRTAYDYFYRADGDYDKLIKALNTTIKEQEHEARMYRRYLDNIRHLYERENQYKVMALSQIIPVENYINSLKALRDRRDLSSMDYDEVLDIWKLAHANRDKDSALINAARAKSIFKKGLVDGNPGYSAPLPGGYVGAIYNRRPGEWTYRLNASNGKTLYMGSGNTLKFGKAWLPLLGYLISKGVVKLRSVHY